MSKRTVLLMGHGSKHKGANNMLFEIAKMVKEKGGYERVDASFMQFGTPSIKEAVINLINNGYDDILLIPYFLYNGAHVTFDIPALVDKLKVQFPLVKFTYGECLGLNEKLAEIVIESIRKEWG